MTAPIIQTVGGRVRGVDRGQSTAYYSIPYAAAPIGELSFALPQPHAGWQGIRDATVPGPTAQVQGFDLQGRVRT